MWNRIPIEDLLLLLRADAIVLVQKVQECRLWLLERGIGAGLQVAQVRKDALLKLFRIRHRPAECLEPEGEAAHNVRAGDVEKVVPGWMSVMGPSSVTFHGCDSSGTDL